LFEKAKNKVPHNQLFYKLESSKIDEKILTVIKGVRQRCPTSPMSSDKVPGLLFDNNAVILAESADKLQKSFDILIEWCKQWNMNANNKKCGIIEINCSTYIFIAEVISIKSLDIHFFKNQKKAINGYRSSYTSYCHIRWEFFGISTTRCKPIQQVVDAATQTLAKYGKSAAIVRLRQELSLTDLNIKTAVARTRAFGKCTSLRTWISDLIKCPFKHRCDTWVSGCTRWTKKYNGNINKI
ncbi:hypothetical protein BB561_006745, partial [Smittium simulii]